MQFVSFVEIHCLSCGEDWRQIALSSTPSLSTCRCSRDVNPRWSVVFRESQLSDYYVMVPKNFIMIRSSDGCRLNPGLRFFYQKKELR